MSEPLSLNTQAILLLTAPLITGPKQASTDVLSLGEYKRLARRLRDMQRQPADLISPDAVDLFTAFQTEFDSARIKRLVERGFQLSQAVEHWQARSIWVVSRADSDYPNRLKSRLKDDAPTILYGCGDRGLLDAGGLAVVGSRDADDALIQYTEEIGQLAAQARRTVVSGGARGIDQAAMRGALEAGGNVIGVLADSLERAVVNRENRTTLMHGQLVLVSPYDPRAGFNVGNAMQRNKLIYALADAALVVSSDYQKGGTWAGAVEQLDKYKSVRLYVRSTGEAGKGLEALRKKGALLWPNPAESDAFCATLESKGQSEAETATQKELTFPTDEPVQAAEMPDVLMDEAPLVKDESPQAIVTYHTPSRQQTVDMVLNPAEELFAKVRELIVNLLSTPRKEADVAAELKVSTNQVKRWLHRLVDEGVLEKQTKPARYVIKPTGLFDSAATSQVRESNSKDNAYDGGAS